MLPKSRKTNRIFHPSIVSLKKLSSPTMLASITVVALVGVYVVTRLLAAGLAAFETDSGSLSGTIAVKTDDNLASGGSYIQFGTTNGANPPPPVTPPPPPPPPIAPPPPPQNPPPPPPPSDGSYDSGHLEAEASEIVYLEKRCVHFWWTNATPYGYDIYPLIDPAIIVLPDQAPDDPAASGGRYCGAFGTTDGNGPDHIRFHVNNVPSGGTYTMKIGYRSGFGPDQIPRWYYVNNGSHVEVLVPPTGSDGGANRLAPWSTQTYSIQLNPGSNTIDWMAPDIAPYWYNVMEFDYLQVTGPN